MSVAAPNNLATGSDEPELRNIDFYDLETEVRTSIE